MLIALRQLEKSTMNWRDIVKRSMPMVLPTHYAVLVVTLAWITQAHGLAAQSVMPTVSTLALPSAVSSDAMPAMDGQACPICLRALVPASLLLEVRNPDHEGISLSLLAHYGASGQEGLVHLDQKSDWDTLPIQIRFCRWHN